MQERRNYKFQDDKMFCTVLAKNPDLAKELIEVILGIEINRVECVNAQKILNYAYDVRSVRFDVYLKDGNGVIYDVEMETTGDTKKLKFLPRRSRYYAGAIDTGEYPEGTEFQDIKDTYIIFICLHDPFKPFGLAKYTCRVRCEENEDVNVNDGVTYIYLNCSAINKNVSNELAELLDFVAGKDAGENALTQRINDAVTRINDDPEWRRWAVTLEQKLREARTEGILEERKAAVITLYETLLKIFNSVERALRETETAYPDSDVKQILEEAGISFE